MAMAMYGVAIIPLIRKLEIKDKMQKWFADDGYLVGSLKNLRKILDVVETTGKGFGYVVKPSSVTWYASQSMWKKPKKFSVVQTFKSSKATGSLVQQ